MTKQLDIFDFDGTLLLTPTRAEAELMRGRPFRFMGWWTNPQSLSDEVISDPKNLRNRPVCDEFERSRADTSTCTVLLTGRKGHLRDRVLDLLHASDIITQEEHDLAISQKNATFDDCCGEKCSYMFQPKFSFSTWDWKNDVILSLATKCFGSQPGVIRIFEDRPRHALAMQRVLSRSCKHTVVVWWVQVGACRPLTDDIVFAELEKYVANL